MENEDLVYAINQNTQAIYKFTEILHEYIFNAEVKNTTEQNTVIDKEQVMYLQDKIKALLAKYKEDFAGSEEPKLEAQELLIKNMKNITGSNKLIDISKEIYPEFLQFIDTELSDD